MVVAGSGTTILLSDTTKNANYNYTAGIAPNSPLDVTFVDKTLMVEMACFMDIEAKLSENCTVG